jgi:hypothetical protein
MSYYDDDNFLRIAKDEPHSGPGIAAFIISLVTGFLYVVFIVIATTIQMNNPGANDHPAQALAGCGILCTIVVNLVGVGLGIGGCCQTHRKLLFAILGLIFNGVQVLGILLLMVIGLAMKP